MAVVPPLAAQTTVSVTGRVTAQGRPVADAQIGVTDRETNRVRGTRTSTNGDYAVVGLAPGVYSVRVLRVGFAPLTQEIRLLVGQHATLNFELQETAVTLSGVQVSSPDDSVTIVLWVPDTDSFEDAAKAMGDQIDKQLDNVKTDNDGSETTVNGMPAYTLTGTGKYEGTPVHWAVDLIKAKKPFIALSIGESAKLQQHLDGYKKLVASIKPV